MADQSIRKLDPLKIEHFKREIGSRNTKLIHLEDKLTSIMTRCREMFRSQKFTTIEQCYMELTELKHVNERFTKCINEKDDQLSIMKSNDQKSELDTTKMSQETELHRLEKGVNELRGQQTLNHEQEKKTEYKSNIISVIQHFEKKIECRDLQVKQLEKYLNEMKALTCHLENKLKDKDSQLLKTCRQLNLTLYRLKTTETEHSETITSLKRKILGTAVDIESRDQIIKELEERLESVRKEMTVANELFRKKIKTQDEQLLKTRDDLQRASDQLYDFETDQTKNIKSLKNKIQEKDNQISELSDQLKQHHTSKQWQNREAEFNKIIATLERKLKQCEEKLEATLDAVLEIRLKKIHDQSDQRGRTLENMQASETEFLGTVAFLKTKVIDIEAESDLKVRDLGKLFNRLMTQQKDENKLLVNRLEEKDRKQEEQLKQANNTFHEREVEMNNIIISVRKEQEDQSHLKLELKDQQKQTLKRVNEKEAEINTALNRKLKDFEAEMDRREQKVKHLNELLDDRKTEVTILSERNDFLEKKLKETDDRLRKQNEQLRMKTHHLQKKVEERDRKVSDLEDMLQKKQKENMVNEEENDVSGKVEKTSELDEQLKQTVRELHDREVELDDTKNLPNKATGGRPTEINTNISDLSDRNRPTKLAERCAELYDNQWMDAFDTLEKYFDTEANVIEALLKILQDAMTFCKTKARTQMEELGRELTFAEQHVQGNGDIIADVRKLFNDCKRIMAPVAVGNLYKRYASRLKRSTDKTFKSALEVSSYTSQCLEICWLMVIHDPPVVFAPVVRKGSSFNSDLYKPYTTSGTHIDYLVWPSVLLHEGGPVLAKGIAQGYSNL